MASETKYQAPKDPVLDSNFRMSVERTISRFSDSTDESYEVPIFFSKEQKNFVRNLATKLGLKVKSSGAGLNAQIILYKKEESSAIASNVAEMNPSTRSKMIIDKVFEFIKDSNILPPVTKPIKHLPPGLATIGSVSNFRTINITTPKDTTNPDFDNFRKSLPIHNHRNQIMELIKNNQVVVIESSTGSGKSTQIAQYIIEDRAQHKRPCRILMTEPKRICAASLAERVSKERGEHVGETVGYQIRLESQISPDSNLIYVTNGVILRMLMCGKPEKFFKEVTTLIIDEVHERDKFCDYLLLCVHEFLPKNSEIRIIILSATVDSTIFSEYFGNCAVYKIDGRSHPIEVKYLEEVLQIVENQSGEKAELVQSSSTKMLDQHDKAQTTESHSEDATETQNLDEASKSQVEEIPPITTDTFTERNLAIANSYLEKLEGSPDDSWIFLQFADMIRARDIPVDFRSSKSNKTCLEVMTENKMEFEELQLLSLYDDPKIIKSSTDIKKITTETDRLLLAYYETLVRPGLRGVFLEDSVDLFLISKLIQHLHTNSEHEHGILVFLPGHDDIIRLANIIFDNLDVSSYEIFILHSQMKTKDQINVFDKLEPGVRKIVLSTNIGESSITIDVTFVIDSGKEKSKIFNPMTLVSSLNTQWISKSSAKQRMGRAGRMQAGVVYRMYSRDRFESFKENSEPNFLRDDISDLCLQTKMIANPTETIHSFLNKALTPPSEAAIVYTVKFLQDIGALDFDETLTLLGRQLADIPLNARHAKMLIYSIIMRCVDPILTIVSAISVGDPFTLPFKKEDRQLCHSVKRDLEDSSFSDHFVLLRIFQKWNQYKSINQFDGGFCEDNLVNSATLDRIILTRHKIVAYLRSVKLLPSVGNISNLNINGHSWPTVKLCIAAGSYPLIGHINKAKGEINTNIDKSIGIHHSSALHLNSDSRLTKKEISAVPGNYIVFEEKKESESNRISAKICTLVTSVCTALVAGTQITSNDNVFEHEISEDCTLDLEIDKFIRMSATQNDARRIQEIRLRLDNLIKRLLDNPGRFRPTPHEQILVNGISKLLEYEDEKAGFKINFENIGSRPRIVTVGNSETTNQTTTRIRTEFVHKNNRYFMVPIRDDEQLINILKSKQFVFFEEDANLSGEMLAHLENEDRFSRKIMLFYTDKEIIGVGTLLENREQEVKRQNLRMFFQSEQRISFEQLVNFAGPDIIQLLHPFAEIPQEIGRHCADVCMAKPKFV